MSRIFVTGGRGQLATALARAAGSAVQVLGRPAFDFERPETLDAVFANGGPDLLINAAAWTAVDLAEQEEAAAYRANATGPGRLAELCAQHGTKLIHISTDYVFDGAKGAPYVETDAVNPTGVYGASKLAGEQAVLAALPGAVILRTSWVYAEGGKNFVRTMLNAARRNAPLRVVADQHGCPTNADDLAASVLAVGHALLGAGGTSADSLGGIYHASGAGEATWHGFAQGIFAAAGPHGWPVPTVMPIATADWPTPARRPADSRLDCGKLEATFGVRPPPWQPSLVRAVNAICAAELAA